MTSKTTDIFEQLDKLSILDLAQLKDKIETEWRVSAVQQQVVQPGQTQVAPEEEAQVEFSVWLTNAGQSRLPLIKELRALTGLGLKEAKEMADGAPVEVQSSLSQEDADSLRAKLEAAGATIELR